MPKGDGTGPYGKGTMNESGHCEGRGRGRHNVKKPLGDQKQVHARSEESGRPGGRGRCRDRRHEDCGCDHHDHEHHHAHGDHHGECDHHHEE